MKHFFFLFFSFVFLSLFNTSFLDNEVKAASIPEQEPNDEINLATAIQLNTTYTGYSTYKVYSGYMHTGDFDYYKFTLDKPGQVTLSMKNHRDYTWSFILQNSDNKIFIDADTENGVKVIDQKITNSKRSVGLPAGTYYVQVYGNDSKMEHIPYELTVNFNESNSYEQEPNDEMKSATAIQLNTTYTGYSTYKVYSGYMHTGDFDYYKFTLDKPGQVTLSMKNHEDYTWSFLLQNSDNKIFIDADTENGVKVIDQKITNSKRSVGLPAGTYYVQVYGNDSKMEHIPYELTVNFNKSNSYEQEPNDEMKSATAIQLNTTYTGYSTYKVYSGYIHTGDFDYYKFTLDKPGQVTLSMKNHRDYTWSFILQNSDNKIFIDADTENGVKVTNEKIAYTNKSVGLPAGTYYVRVYGNHGGMEDVAYSISVKKLIALTVNKVTSKTTTVTGKTEAKASVEVKLGSKSLGKATADSKGNYKVKIKAQKKGTKLTIIARDKAKNAKTVTTTVK